MNRCHQGDMIPSIDGYAGDLREGLPGDCRSGQVEENMERNVFPGGRWPAVIWFFLALPIVVLLSLAWYAHPANDDYWYAMGVRFDGFWGIQRRWYLTWNGRFTANFVQFGFPVLFDMIRVYPLVFVSMIAGFSISLGVFLDGVNRAAGWLVSRRIVLASTFVFVSVYLTQMPSPCEGFFWLAGGRDLHPAADEPAVDGRICAGDPRRQLDGRQSRIGRADGGAGSVHCRRQRVPSGASGVVVACRHDRNLPTTSPQPLGLGCRAGRVCLRSGVVGAGAGKFCPRHLIPQVAARRRRPPLPAFYGILCAVGWGWG